MPSKSANPSLATPSQARSGCREGVETGWGPPDRATAKAKAQSRPRTLVGFRAAAKAEVVWDQESPGSIPGGATRSPAMTFKSLPGLSLSSVFASTSTDNGFLRGNAPVAQPSYPALSDLLRQTICDPQGHSRSRNCRRRILRPGSL